MPYYNKMYEAEGSSPLARGLLGVTVGRLGQRRIIPARAGFTLPGCEQHRLDEDHPRSRGVYMIVVTFGYAVDGSSPLARGLLRESEDGGDDGRIIPARAGFT